MAGSENRVTIVIDGRNDAGGAFAAATAEAEAFKKAAEDANRASIAGSLAQVRAWNTLRGAIRGVIDEQGSAMAKVAQAFSAFERLPERGRFGQLAGGLTGGLLNRLLYGGSGDSSGFLSGLNNVIMRVGNFIGKIPFVPGGYAGAAIGAGVATFIGAGGLGIIPGLLSAAAGIGAVGALAFPTFRTVLGFPAQLAASQQALTYARQQQQLDRLAGSSPFTLRRDQLAVRQAQQGVDTTRDTLSPAQVQAVQGIAGIQSQWAKMSAAFAPRAMPIFNDMLKGVQALMPALTTLANAAAPAINGLLKQFDKFAASPGFKQFIAEIAKLAGPWITALGKALGELAIAVGKFLMALANPNAIRVFSLLMSGLAKVITGVAVQIAAFTRGVIASFHAVAVAFDYVRRSAAIFGHDVAHQFDMVRHAVAAAFDAVRAILTHASTDMANWVRNVIRFGQQAIIWFDQFPAKVASALAKLPGILLHIAVAAMQGFLNGLISMGGRVLSWVAGFAAKVGSIFAGALHIFSPSRVFFRHGQMIGQGLIDGMNSMTGGVAGASLRMAGATQAGIGASGGVMTVHLVLTGGDADFRNYLQKVLRVGGGDPRILTQKVRLA